MYESNAKLFEKVITHVIETSSGAVERSPMVNPTFLQRFLDVALTFFANASTALDVQDQQIKTALDIFQRTQHEASKLSETIRSKRELLVVQQQNIRALMEA